MSKQNRRPPGYPDRGPLRTPDERLGSIEDALWGPERQPNGLVGDVREMKKDLRPRLRRLEIGVAVLLVSTVSPTLGGPSAPQVVAAIGNAIGGLG